MVRVRRHLHCAADEVVSISQQPDSAIPKGRFDTHYRRLETEGRAGHNIGNILYGTGITGTGSTLSSGSLGVGTTSPWRKFSVTGTVGIDGLTGATGAGSLCLSANKEVVYNSGSDSCLSSLRSTKHDINPIAVDAFAQILALQPVSFIYDNDASSTVQ